MSRDLLLIAIALFTWGLGESSYRLFQPLYLEQLGASPVVIGSILSAVGITMTLSHIPAGYLADRFGRRIMMWIAWFLGVLSGTVMTLAQSLETFTIGMLLYGVTIFVIAPMNSYVTAARGKWSVGRAITFTSAFYNIGAIIGPIIGGLIGERYGYSKAYLYATVVFVISTVVILFLRPQPKEKSIENTRFSGLLNRLFLSFLPIIFFAHFGMNIAQPLAPNFLQNTHQLTISQIGILGSVSSFGTVIMSFGLGALNARLGFILGQVASGLFPFFLWRGTGYGWFAAGYFMLGGYRPAGALAIAQLRDRISESNMGLAYGIAEATSGTAIILAPLLAGFLYEANPDWVFQTAIGFTLISVIITLVFTKHRSTNHLEGDIHG
jgi:MFS family permease